MDEEVGGEVEEHNLIPVAAAPAVFAEVLEQDRFPSSAAQSTPPLPSLPPIPILPTIPEYYHQSHVSTHIPPLVPELPQIPTKSDSVEPVQYAKYPTVHQQMAQPALNLPPLSMPHEHQQQHHQQVTRGNEANQQLVLATQHRTQPLHHHNERREAHYHHSDYHHHKQDYHHPRSYNHDAYYHQRTADRRLLTPSVTRILTSSTAGIHSASALSSIPWSTSSLLIRMVVEYVHGASFAFSRFLSLTDYTVIFVQATCMCFTHKPILHVLEIVH
jgi:hypothetical protein